MFEESDNRLHAALAFSDFVSAFEFMTVVAELAESHGHHPEWRNIYNKVWITLTTHDAGNTVTDKDYELAKAIQEHPTVMRLNPSNIE